MSNKNRQDNTFTERELIAYRDKLRSSGKIAKKELLGLQILAKKATYSPEARAALSRFKSAANLSNISGETGPVSTDSAELHTSDSDTETETLSPLNMSNGGSGDMGEGEQGGADGGAEIFTAILNTLCEKFQEIQVSNQNTFLKMLEEREQHWKQQQQDMLKTQQTTFNNAPAPLPKQRDRVLIKPPTPFIRPTAMRNTEQFLKSYRAYAEAMTSDPNQHFLGLEHSLQGDALTVYNTYKIKNPNNLTLDGVSQVLMSECKISPKEDVSTYDTRKQGVDETVDSYARDLKFLMAKEDLSDVQQKSAFVSNLTDHLKFVVKQKDPSTLKEAIIIATDAELTITAQDMKAKAKSTGQDDKLDKIATIVTGLAKQAEQKAASVEAVYSQDMAKWGEKRASPEPYQPRRQYIQGNTYRPYSDRRYSRSAIGVYDRRRGPQDTGPHYRSLTPHPETRNQFQGDRRRYQQTQERDNPYQDRQSFYRRDNSMRPRSASPDNRNGRQRSPFNGSNGHLNA